MIPRRLPLLLLSLTVLPLLGSCDYFRPLEQICEKRLGPTTVKVEAVPVAFQTDLSLSTEQLTAKGASSVDLRGGRMVLGLTATTLKTSVTFGTNGITQRFGGRHCMRPSVNVRLAFEPMTVYVTRAHAKGSCEFDLTMDHEMKHVNTYARFLEKIAPEVEAELRDRFGNQVFYFDSVAQAQQHVERVAREFLGPYVQASMDKVTPLQAQLDTPEEYFRLDRFHEACASGRSPR